MKVCKLCGCDNQDIRYETCEVCGKIICFDCIDWHNSVTFVDKESSIVCMDCGEDFIPY